MHKSRTDEYQCWNEWLPEHLGLRLDEIKTKVDAQFDARAHEPHLKYYTPHGTSHCKAVEDNLHRLIPDDRHTELTDSEKFFLLGGAWLHDIGMFRGIFEGDSRLGDDIIRNDHHLRSERFIAERYAEIGVKETETAPFQLLARFHRRKCEIYKCPETVSVPFHGVIRIRLLAAFLRLADALHIDASRAPADQYAISLTYNIPFRVKLHWLGSIFVLGTQVDTKGKEIIVHLKAPTNFESDPEKAKIFNKSLKQIHKIIVQDLNDEIDSVKNVLIQTDVTRFLRAREEIHHIVLSKRHLDEITPVINYYDLIDNPSSSALHNLVLESLQSIVSTNKGADDTNIDDTLKKCIFGFIDEVRQNVLKPRKCHAGLSKLLKSIGDNFENGKIPTVEEFENTILRKRLDINLNRETLRLSARNYFDKYIVEYININKLDNIDMRLPKSEADRIEEQISSLNQRIFTVKSINSTSKAKKKETIFNILLYGYSELVIKALCGFRDSIVRKLMNVYLDEHPRLGFHKADFEATASNYFRIFCCEGQPKNHTAWGGRVIYHDGIKYALSLAERGFKAINIIPDAVAPTLLVKHKDDNNGENIHIDFVIVGANGFDNEYFSHSAGHIMVASALALAKEIDEKLGRSKPIMVLALMTDKYKDEKNNDDNKNTRDTDNRSDVIEQEGWLFRNPFGSEAVRVHSFISQDRNIQKSVSQENARIMFYNPREDRIPIDQVDVVITEKEFLEKKSFQPWTGERISKGSK